MIRLSVKGLAKYMTSNPAAQRKVLRDFKFPRGDESVAMRLYYRDACDRIQAYHKIGHDSDWLREKADDLLRLARINGGQSAIRLRHNSRALRSYDQKFSDRKFDIDRELRLHLEYSDVRVSVTPDLHVHERGKEKIIKFDFGTKPSSTDTVKIISQCMFEAARGHVADLTSASVLFIDVSRGKEYRGARAQARTVADINAACETISAVWPSIKARP